NEKKRPRTPPLREASEERGSPQEEMADQKGRKVALESEKQHLPNSLLRRARQERGWSQKELADRIDTDPVNISRWEHGSHFPSPYYRLKLSEVFGKAPAELGLIPSTSAEHDLVSSPQSPVPVSKIWNVPIAHNPYFT